MISLTSILNPPAPGHPSHCHASFPASCRNTTFLSRPRIFAQPSIPSPPISTSSSPTTPPSLPQMVLHRPGFGPINASRHQREPSPPRSVTMPTPQQPAQHPAQQPPPVQQQKQQQQQLTKTRPRGAVRFAPYENFEDETALQEVRRFCVRQLGTIRNSCTHIPYNSGKKDFFEKTGRESFEVFRYEFTMPDDNTEYSVMWDYNIGLVRMTPFFKCCQYGKTVPAKMLNLNPGLKDITHSITGGSITAQGYWMPFSCARAICATFCYKIAGALVPMFGPSFLYDCLRPDSPSFGRMVIDPTIIAEAAREAEVSRRVYYNANMLAAASNTSNASRSMTASPTARWPGYRHYHHKDKRHLPSGGRLLENSVRNSLPISPPWSTSDDLARGRHHRFKTDVSAMPWPPQQQLPYSQNSHLVPSGRLPQPQPQPQPYRRHEEPTDAFLPNPILSAVPRSFATGLPKSRWTAINSGTKRPAPLDTPSPDPGPSTGLHRLTNNLNGIATMSTGRVIDQELMEELDRTAEVAARKAAMLLMNLSARDPKVQAGRRLWTLDEFSEGVRGGLTEDGPWMAADEDGGHRAKRRRATSM